MKIQKKPRYSLRNSFSKNKQTFSDLNDSALSSKSMGRTIKVETVKSGTKRTRGRPRTKESKTVSVAKRHKSSLSHFTTAKKSPQRKRSLSPTHQEPPQLEPMPTVEEEDDLDIPLSYSSLISIDNYLCPGKCIVICPVANCRKKFSNPIDLVSHLRIYHKNDTFTSLKIYTCPICLKTRFSSHTTSSDLNLLSEHAARYHGQTFKQTEFVYFCTIMLDLMTGDKTTQKREEIICKKEMSCMSAQTRTDSQYHPILPLVPNSAPSEVHAPRPMEVSRSTVTRLNTDNLSLCISPLSQESSSASHYIQISVASRLPAASSSITSQPSRPQPVLAALAAAAVSGRIQSTAMVTPGNTSALLLQASPSASSSDPPRLINNTSICTSTTQFPVFISSSTVGDVAHTFAANQSPQSASTSAAIATLQQLIQTAAANKTLQPSSSTVASPTVHQSCNSSSVNTNLVCTAVSTTATTPFLQPAPVAALVTDVRHQRNYPAAKSLSTFDKLPSFSRAQPIVQGVTTGSANQAPSNAIPIPTSSGTELDINSDLSPASANADLLTLARLSVKQATAEALTLQQESQLSSIQKNRRLLPRQSTAVAPIVVRKRVGLPPLAVKPPKEAVSTTGVTPAKSGILVPASPVPQLATNHSEPTTTVLPTAVAGGGSSETVWQDEVSMITAALISPPRTTSATPVRIASGISNVLAKSRLLQASTYISVQPRPPPAQAPVNPLIQRVLPTIRPAPPLQKILPRPNAGNAVAPSKDVRPLTLPNQTPMVTQSLTPSKSVVSSGVVSARSPSVKVTTSNALPSRVNGNTGVPGGGSSVSYNPSASSVDEGQNTLVICTSPSELNISM